MKDEDSRHWDEWASFHECSKLTRLSRPPSDEFVVSMMRSRPAALTTSGASRISVSTVGALNTNVILQLLRKRRSPRAFRRACLPAEVAAILLKCAYGILEIPSEGIVGMRRTVPSAGALFPLELVCFTPSVENWPKGGFLYNDIDSSLDQIAGEEACEALCSSSVVTSIEGAPLVIAIVAFFERVTAKYGDRGYRFALIEAGHVAQNVTLAATSLGLACLPIGGFFDREVDAILRVDGSTASCVYLLAVGEPSD